MHDPPFWDAHKRTLFCGINAIFGFNLDFAIDHIKRFLKIGMCVRTRATAGGDQHIDGSKSSTCLFTGDKNTIGVADYGQILPIFGVYRQGSGF